MKINNQTPKQFARNQVIKYLELLFDSPEIFIQGFNNLTFKQQEEVLRHISLDEDRIRKLLGDPKGVNDES
jgi:hypothetical protein